MIYALVAMLACILIFAYVAAKQDLLSPWVLITASFLNSSVLAMLNLEYWQYGFHMNTCLVIVASVVSFGLGNMFVMHAFKWNGYTRISGSERPYVLPLWVIAACILVEAAWAAVSARELYQLSEAYGNSEGLKHAIPVVRTMLEAKVVMLPRIIYYGFDVALAISTFFMGLFLRNLIWFGWRKVSLLWLLPLLGIVPHTLLTTGRVGFLTFTLVGLIEAVVLYQLKHGCSFRNNLRLVSVMAMVFVFFFASFFAAGSLTWKGLSADRGPFKIISHYTGAQVPAFDVYLNQLTTPEDTLIGPMTLIGIHGNLRALGFDIKPRSTFLEFTHFANVDTNIYTSLRAYINDYGYIGMAMVSFLLGTFCTAFYQLLAGGRLGFMGLLAYASIAWPLFLFGHNETFFVGVFTTTSIYILSVIAVLYLVLRRYNKNVFSV